MCAEADVWQPLLLLLSWTALLALQNCTSPKQCSDTSNLCISSSRIWYSKGEQPCNVLLLGEAHGIGVQRDIPMPLVSSGVEKGNLRELALARMGDLGLQCRDVRTREAGIQDIHHKVLHYSHHSLEQNCFV